MFAAQVKQLEKVGLIQDCPVGYERDAEGRWACKPRPRVEGTQYFYGGFKSNASSNQG